MAGEWITPAASAATGTAAVITAYLTTRRAADNQTTIARLAHEHERALAELSHGHETQTAEADRKLAAYAECITAVRSIWGDRWDDLDLDGRVAISAKIGAVELLGSPEVSRRAHHLLRSINSTPPANQLSLQAAGDFLVEAMREDAGTGSTLP